MTTADGLIRPAALARTLLLAGVGWLMVPAVGLVWGLEVVPLVLGPEHLPR